MLTSIPVYNQPNSMHQFRNDITDVSLRLFSYMSYELNYIYYRYRRHI